MIYCTETAAVTYLIFVCVFTVPKVDEEASYEEAKGK